MNLFLFVLCFTAVSSLRVCERASYDLDYAPRLSTAVVHSAVAKDINECAIACGAHETCTAARYTQQYSACYLYSPNASAVMPRRRRRQIPRQIPLITNIKCAEWAEAKIDMKEFSGEAAEEQIHRLPCPAHGLNFTLSRGKRYYDGVIDAMPAASALVCAQACYENVLCTGANLHALTKSCELTSSHVTGSNTAQSIPTSDGRMTVDKQSVAKLVVTNRPHHVAVTNILCRSRTRSILDFENFVELLRNLLTHLQNEKVQQALASSFPSTNAQPDTNSQFGIPRNPNDISIAPTNFQCGQTPIIPSVNPMSMRAQSVAQSRIMGGLESVPNSWPWQVAIFYYSKQGQRPSLICGGSLISDKAFVTAAHCFKFSRDLSRFTFLLGAHTLSDDNERRTIVKGALVHVHEQYGEPIKHSADIALVILEQPVTFNEHIQPVCLTQRQARAGEKCVATGWGKNDVGVPSDVLLQTVVQVVDTTVCNDAKHYKGRIHRPSMFCAADQGKDSCQGDSGGPLVCAQADGTWRLSGIISWGVGCGDPNKPGVYVRVEQFRSWIHQRMNSVQQRVQSQSNPSPSPFAPWNQRPSGHSVSPTQNWPPRPSRGSLFSDSSRVTLFPRDIS